LTGAVNRASEDLPRTRLPHVLAVLYTLAIVYASLQPFSGWTPPPDATFWLLAPPKPWWTRLDVAANIVAYVPFGAFVALLARRASPAARVLSGTLAGLALSFAMETLQDWLPTRDATIVDLAANVAGAFAGAVVAAAIARRPTWRAALSWARHRLFLPGTLGDIGIALVALWLVAQTNPAIPLFALTWEPLASPAAGADRAALLIEAAQSGFQMLGVGLFIALLVRHREHAGATVLLLIGAALVAKGAAAYLLLRPEAWEGWIRPGLSTGVAVGAIALVAAIALPRPAMVTLCAIALLASLLVPLLEPEGLFASPPASQFGRRYAHLLTFNGLTRAVLVAWPLAATAWLFLLAGRPAWGAPDSAGTRPPEPRVGSR